jgi:hypothetical protein
VCGKLDTYASEIGTRQDAMRLELDHHRAVLQRDIALLNAKLDSYATDIRARYEALRSALDSERRLIAEGMTGI